MVSPLKSLSLLDWNIARPALVDSIVKLDPRHQIRNPAVFVVESWQHFDDRGCFLQALAGHGEAPTGFRLSISLWLLVYGDLCQLRRSDGRRPRQSPGVQLAQSAPRHAREKISRGEKRQSAAGRVRPAR